MCGHLPPCTIYDTICPVTNVHLHQSLHGERLAVIHHYGRTFHLRVHLPSHTADARREHVGKLLQRQQLVVPRELICPRNARSRHVVVELMPDDAAPGVGHHSDGIAIGTHPVGHHRRALGSIAEVFVLPVVELHRCLRRVAAVAVQVHIQLAAERGQFLRQPLGDGVLVELVARSADDLQRTVALHAFHHTTHRGHRRRTADVARTIVAVHQAQIALADLAQQHCIARQVLVGQPLRVVVAVSHEDLTAVDALPHAEGIGIAAAALVERLVAPHQLLRRETYQPAVFGQRGHRIGEAEAVGQEHIGALLAELLAIERLAEQDVTNPRLR